MGQPSERVTSGSRSTCYAACRSAAASALGDGSAAPSINTSPVLICAATSKLMVRFADGAGSTPVIPSTYWSFTACPAPGDSAKWIRQFPQLTLEIEHSFDTRERIAVWTEPH